MEREGAISRSKSLSLSDYRSAKDRERLRTRYSYVEDQRMRLRPAQKIKKVDNGLCTRRIVLSVVTGVEESSRDTKRTLTGANCEPPCGHHRLFMKGGRS